MKPSALASILRRRAAAQRREADRLDELADEVERDEDEPAPTDPVTRAAVEARLRARGFPLPPRK